MGGKSVLAPAVTAALAERAGGSPWKVVSNLPYAVATPVILHLLALGLGAAVTRELARLAAVAGSAREQRDVVATTAAVFWGVGVAVFLAVLAFSGHASRDWFHAAELDAGTVRTALILMGVLLCLQMPGSLYFSGLMGLHRQIHANAVVVAVAVVRNVGAWLVLLAVRDLSGVIAFFAWHALMHVVQAGILKFLVARHLPPAAERGRFRRATLRHLWRCSWRLRTTPASTMLHP